MRGGRSGEECPATMFAGVAVVKWVVLGSGFGEGCVRWARLTWCAGLVCGLVWSGGVFAQKINQDLRVWK